MNVRYASTVTSKSIIKNLKSLNAALAMLTKDTTVQIARFL